MATKKKIKKLEEGPKPTARLKVIDKIKALNYQECVIFADASFEKEIESEILSGVDGNRLLGELRVKGLRKILPLFLGRPILWDSPKFEVKPINDLTKTELVSFVTALRDRIISLRE